MDALPFNPLPAPVNGKRSREDVRSRLPSELQEFVGREENSHILDYICRLPLEQVEIPEFHLKISRAMKSIRHPNLIYPIGKGLAVHIYPDKEDIRNYYIPIEPCLFQDIDSTLEAVEKLLIDVIHDGDVDTKDLEEKKRLLERALEKVCIIEEHVNESVEQKSKDLERNKTVKRKKNGRLRLGLIGNLKEAGKVFKMNKWENIRVTPEEFQAIKYLMIRDKIGMGMLEPLLLDSNIEDISCSGLGRVFVEHKVFSSLKTAIEFQETEELNSFIIQMSEKVGKPITYRDPIVDTALPDGSRINIVFGEDVSRRGSNFTIRKFMGTPISILELIDFGTIDYIIAAYMWMMLRAGMNCFISGETASGKTTMMNAITTFLPPESKIVSIEDTPELQVPHKNWTREVTRTTREDSGSDVSMFDLLKAALRQRPNEIIIGEIRGVEGSIAFQAMQTGHPVMSTFHAASVEKLIQRLTGDPINVPKNYVDNLNVVIIQSAVNIPGKGMGRRVLSINEIVGYDSFNQAFNFMDIFKWDPATDTFKFTGRNNSYLLEQKIAPRLGIPENQVRKIYSELERKAKILQKIHQAKITNFYDLFNTLIQIEEAGLIS
ncbi:MULTISPECIES: type II/IV secretion system ATPase subunit [Methanosarcina]|uniref:Flagella-related protein FlaI n=3 Tax=Methanosarcina barkeri TaxID=2208 RepID=A0A0E3QS94_METBA|nr:MULTISPECIES: type II/IV secretion system ATPase subunit [Methanosarcina]AKB53697.1 Flagella-related protein FlaI [Methanosarcina barkeri MS]AKB58193.1 Flagella-related protein FlaI [Methanosarcina barkeri 227]AKJ38970.1 archaeal flagellar protein I FlaI [Methanosarcina barkeri CM1]OEC90116.1 secretion system protein E [Methanosarcina sp. A14]